jgi:hypothetical protein
MRKLDSEQEIRRLAAGLKVDWQQNAVQNIIQLCHKKISEWLKESHSIRSIHDLEALVKKKVKLVFEEVRTDEELTAVIRKYLGLGEPVFATLKSDLDENTFATLIERRRVTGKSEDRYVAVIDCRGSKAARRFFTRWHEIAHLLTLHGQLELPLHRSTTDRSPTERLMDTIAAEIGFYDPLFRPILLEETREEGLTFAAIERIRTRYCPEASFQSTLNACVSRFDQPTLVAEIGFGLKREEERQLNSRQVNLSPAPRPEPKLRVLSIGGNAASRGTPLKIHPNMQVPSDSVLYRFFNSDTDNNETSGVESLKIWRHSDGTVMGNIDVVIRAKRVEKLVTVLISSLND